MAEAENKTIIILVTIRFVMSLIGIMGNMFLIFVILQTKISRIKSFEVFLLSLAVSNLEVLMLVDVYEIIMLINHIQNSLLCKTIKFFNLVGEVSSILFTVLICVYRYQKLRDAEKRGNAPIFLDSRKSAWVTSGLCMFYSTMLGLLVYFVKIDTYVEVNNGTMCSPDFFQCHKKFCPPLNRFYKYLFLVSCILLPLLVVTVSSSLIVKVLMDQKRVVAPALGVGASGAPAKKSKGTRLQRSTVAMVMAMVVFQIDWTLYLVLHLAFSPIKVPLWGDLEFFITTSYTTLSPYVYGIGQELFTLRYFMKS